MPGATAALPTTLPPWWGSRGLRGPGAAAWRRICLTGVNPVMVMLMCGAARALCFPDVFS